MNDEPPRITNPQSHARNITRYRQKRGQHRRYQEQRPAVHRDQQHRERRSRRHHSLQKKRRSGRELRKHGTRRAERHLRQLRMRRSRRSLRQQRRSSNRRRPLALRYTDGMPLMYHRTTPEYDMKGCAQLKRRKCISSRLGMNSNVI